jgi:GH3 auxin-responsive promoter
MHPIPLRNRIRTLVSIPFRAAMRKDRRRFLDTARTRCRTAQQAVLADLLRLNSDSAFSVQYRLRPDLSVQEFRERIPVSDYELVRPWIERMKTGDHRALLGSQNRLVMFAITSGTTASSKLIPVTEQFVRRYRRSWQLWGIDVYTQHPRLKNLSIMQVAGSHRRFATADGTPCGSISGLVASTQKRVVRSMYAIPYDVVRISNPSAKRYAILRLALADPLIGMMITANPSTLTQLFACLQGNSESLVRDIHDGGIAACDIDTKTKTALHRALQARPERARELARLLERDGQLLPSSCWPHVELLGVWSGGSVGAYLPMLRRLFPNAAVRDHGLHASEGRMTLPIEDNTPAGVLEIETHFFEFVPVDQADATDPIVLEAHELEDGEEYLILLTTCSGLYRYNIHDVVRCVGFHGETPLLEFRHKGAHISSITGEKIAESQVVEAVQSASTDIGAIIPVFTLTPVWGTPPGYVLYVDTELCDADRQRFCHTLGEAVDLRLRKLNVEYDDKRSSQRLRKIRVEQLPPAAWQLFIKTRTSNDGGSLEQYKHPCLLPDPKFDNLFLSGCGLNHDSDH